MFWIDFSHDLGIPPDQCHMCYCFMEISPIRGQMAVRNGDFMPILKALSHTEIFTHNTGDNCSLWDCWHQHPVCAIWHVRIGAVPSNLYHISHRGWNFSPWKRCFAGLKVIFILCHWATQIIPCRKDISGVSLRGSCHHRPQCVDLSVR